MSNSTISERRNDQETRPLSWGLILRVFGSLGPYKWVLFAGNILCLICAAADIAIIRSIKEIVDHPGLLTTPIGILLGPLAAFCILNRFTGFAQWIATFFSTNRALEGLRIRFFEKLQTLSKGFHDQHQSGWLIARNTGDMMAVFNFMTFSLMILVFFLTQIAFAFIEMAAMSPVLLLPSVFVVPIVFVVTSLYKHRMSSAQRKAKEQNSRLVANLAENVKGVRVVQAFSREQYNLGQFDELNRTSRDLEIRVSRLNGLFLPSIGFLGILNTTVVVTFVTLLMRGTISFLPQVSISTGELVAYILYMNIVVAPIRMLMDMYSMAVGGMAAAERIFEIIDLDPEVADREAAVDIKFPKGEIRFCEVDFRYSASGPWVFRDLNLLIPAGSTFALVGRTGTGKTTLSSLIARFYDVEQGSVTIDGQDIRSFTQESLHGCMGIVLQEGFLFSGSILDNIRFSRPELSKEDIEDIARELGTHDAISSLPDGYDTVVLEGGGSISVGQRQLISLTRALAADPKILLLDEPTSSLDIYTERILQKALERVAKDRTTIIIAHRLSTVRNADRILVIGDGGVVEQGKHEELMARKGHYADLVAGSDERGMLDSQVLGRQACE